MVQNSRYDIIYIDNFNNFYLFKEIFKLSKLRWLFIVFEKKKADECKRYDINYTYVETNFICKLSENYHQYKELYEIAITKDRILRYLPKALATRIIDSQLKAVADVIKLSKPDLVVGEISWGAEYLLYKYCESNNIRYRHLLNLPGESNKVAFFDSEHSYRSLLENSHCATTNKRSHSYCYLCDKVKSYNNNKKWLTLKALINIFDLDQLNDYKKLQIYYKLRRIIKSFYILFEYVFMKMPNIAKDIRFVKEKYSSKRLLFFPLHIQPECTPDFVSPEFNKQLDICIEISLKLPREYILIVKDHPNDVSIRNIFKLIRMYCAPNIIIAKRQISSSELIDISDSSISIAGTIAIESIKKGVRSFLFSNVFYTESSYVYRVFSVGELIDKIEQTKNDNVCNDINT
ncbi:MAG: hypothetical protein AB7I29_08800 [Geobacter sp.]